MTRITRAWSAMSREQRLAAVAALGLLVTMFFPWYGLQNLNRRTGAIYSHDINAFGDVSFVEAAIFLVAAGVIALLLARAEERRFSLPGGDGTIVAIAGGWATLLIFYRVFDRPSGHGYPVGIEWGFFLAFVASASLAYAGWRIRHGEPPEAPVLRRHRPEATAGPGDAGASGSPSEGATRLDGERPRRAPATPVPARRMPHAPGAATGETQRGHGEETGETEVIPLGAPRRSPRAPAPGPRKDRPRYPPAPGQDVLDLEGEQLSFDDVARGRD